MKKRTQMIVYICILVATVIIYMPVSITHFEGYPEHSDVVSIIVKEKFAGPVVLELTSPEEIDAFCTAVSELKLRKTPLKSVYPQSPDLYGIQLWTIDGESFEFWIDGNLVEAQRIGKRTNFVFAGEPFALDVFLPQEGQ